MNKYYLYIYYDVDGTPIYVGIGSTPNRWKAHWKTDTHLSRTLRKRERELGISLYPEFIEADSWEDAQLGEVLYIWCFGRADIGLGPLFNLTDGGEGAVGAIRSSKTLSKMSTAQKGKSRATRGPQSVEHRTKKSAAQSAAQSKPCTIDGITIYPSLKVLVTNLGNGKSGRQHPNFRYIANTTETL